MIYIGIDTGVHTGLAVWDSKRRRLEECKTVLIHQAIEEVTIMHAVLGDELTVVIEDARQRRWIPREKNLATFKGRAMGAGSVKRDASIWQYFLVDKKIRHLMVPPKAGMTKLNADAFQRITGWVGRTSSHARDAAMLVFGR